MENTNVKDYTITHVKDNVFKAQEKKTNGQFGKTCQVEIPQEFIQGKSMGEVVELVKLYVREGRSMQQGRVAMEKLNGGKGEIPEVFEEDDYIQEPIPWMRWLRFGAFACVGMGFVFGMMYLMGGTSSAETPVEPIVIVEEKSDYQILQEEIDELGQKTIEQLTYQEDLRTLRKKTQEAMASKVASYNEQINASKDVVVNINGEIAKLKKQQVTLSTTVIANE